MGTLPPFITYASAPSSSDHSLMYMYHAPTGNSISDINSSPNRPPTSSHDHPVYLPLFLNQHNQPLTSYCPQFPFDFNTALNYINRPFQPSGISQRPHPTPAFPPYDFAHFAPGAPTNATNRGLRLYLYQLLLTLLSATNPTLVSTLYNSIHLHNLYCYILHKPTLHSR